MIRLIKQRKLKKVWCIYLCLSTANTVEDYIYLHYGCICRIKFVILLFEIKERMLEVNNISIRFGDEQVVQNFSCRVEKGGLACLVGRSGCGKTSLLKSLIGLTPYCGGGIKIAGASLNESTCAYVRKITAYLPQELVFPNDDVMDIVYQTFRIGGVKNIRLSIPLLHQNLSRLGLEPELLDKRMAEISGGQRQRLMIAVLGMLDKQIWLLDEPTAALDEKSRDLVIKFLLDARCEGKTIVAVSHDPVFASRCSTIIQLD